MLLTLDEIKRQLRIEPDYTDEDDLLTLLGSAVETRTVNFLCRNLYAPDTTIPDTDADGLILPDDVKLGMLMLLTHFYENRSSSTEAEKMETPLAYNWLVGPYRYIPL